MRIALDAMGGDRGPEVLVAGAAAAAETLDCTVVLLGDEAVLQGLTASCRPAAGRLEIVHAPQVIGMDEAPIDAVRRKKDATVVHGFRLMRAGEVDALVSAGNSGATMAAAIRYLGRLPGVSRPGIAGIFPTRTGYVVMMDVGANVDCRPVHLLQFAAMGSAFAEVVFQVVRPRVGLLSIGEEGGKGNALVKKTHELLTASPLNYTGNVEGRDLFSGNVDVVVCDGFVGNVCLKVSEGLAEALLRMLADEIKKSAMARLGYWLARTAFGRFRKRVDYAEYGGAPLLGLNGTGVICHGRSNDRAIANAIRVAAEQVDRRVNQRIGELLDQMQPQEAAGQGPAEPDAGQEKSTGQQ